MPADLHDEGKLPSLMKRCCFANRFRIANAERCSRVKAAGEFAYFKKQRDKLQTMMRFFASQQMRRNTLALGLCLLAVLFALEAKTAWYGPENGPSSDVQSQKALPADLPALVSHGISTLPPVTLPLALIFAASVAVIAWTNAHPLPGADVDFNHIPVSAAPYFSPSLFFRPPPAL